MQLAQDKLWARRRRLAALICRNWVLFPFQTLTEQKLQNSIKETPQEQSPACQLPTIQQSDVVVYLGTAVRAEAGTIDLLVLESGKASEVVPSAPVSNIVSGVNLRRRKAKNDSTYPTEEKSG